MFTYEFENYLRKKKADLEHKLEIELGFVDRKEEIHSIKLYRQIARIEGFLLSKDYYKHGRLHYESKL